MSMHQKGFWTLKKTWAEKPLENLHEGQIKRNKLAQKVREGWEA